MAKSVASPTKNLTGLRVISAFFKWLTMGLAAFALAACSGVSLPTFSSSPTGFGSQELLDGQLSGVDGETIGTGPVRVALLLPLSGDVAAVGTAMVNGARLAMQFVADSPNLTENITIVVKDTGGDSALAAQRASEAVSEGASLILGPLKADSVRAVGAVARSAGVPVIGFSNNSGAASPGVYLLNVLPEVEVKRSLAYAQQQGKQAVAAILPNNSYGRIQDGALRQAASELGMNLSAVYSFSNEEEARTAVAQITPFLEQGAIDTLFIPDRATAPSFGELLREAGLDQTRLMVIGSIDWDGDDRIPQTSFLIGAVYPDVSDEGYAALKSQYEAQFGPDPHPFITLSYTAALLANSPALSQSQPRYDAAQLTRASGFNGRDGLFRLFPSGQSAYALAIKQIVVGGAQQVGDPLIP